MRVNANTPTIALSTKRTSIKPKPVAPVWRIEQGQYELQVADIGCAVDPLGGARITSFTLDGKQMLYTPGGLLSGSTFWPSPQQEWGWPPADAWDSAAYSAALDQQGASLALCGVRDPKTGYRLSKRLEASSCRSGIDIVYSIHNDATRPRHVAPWEVSRVPSGGLTFFPHDTTVPIDVTGDMPALEPSATLDSVVWFQHEGQSSAKMYRDGAEAWIGHAAAGVLFLKRYQAPAHAAFAPGESEVELYADAHYVEIEQQGAQVTLDPGESLDWRVSWIAKTIPSDVEIAVGSPSLLSFARTLVSG